MSIEKDNPCKKCIILKKFPYGLLTEEEIALARVCEAQRAYFSDDEHQCTGVLDWMDKASLFYEETEKIRQN